MSPVAAAAAGAACISSSAVLMQLASTSASITALGRCAFALPVLGVLALLERKRGAPRLPSRSRWLARLAGVFLAGDLILWSHAISAIGAGLGTVVTNLQVLFISLLAWLVLGERPRRSLVLASPIMLAGLALVGGLAGLGGTHAYGTDPRLGVVFGVGVGFLYSIYILVLRQATSPRESGGTRKAVAGVLFEATVGATAGSVALGFALRDFNLGHDPLTWPTLGWLALLALTSQVVGWLLITVSMPRLPAGMIGALLLVQPAGSVALSYVILDERPSGLQLLGVAMVLTGVLVAVGVGAPKRPEVAPAVEAMPAVEGAPAVGAVLASKAVLADGGGYWRRSTRIMRHASAASTGRSASKSP
jgi:drug/metabolite transporter (DMT)-like permease